MSWIDDNKNQGIWPFVEQGNKIVYNEGNRLASVEDPVWKDAGQGDTPITPTHAPCGYWSKGKSEGKGYQDEGSAISCEGATIGYTDLTPREYSSQILTIVGGADNVYYYWHLTGAGNINGFTETTIPAIGIRAIKALYTAGEVSGTVSLATSLGEICDTVAFSPWSCCAGVSINYTTQQMNINETQNLSVVGALSGCTYVWSLSGGGSLSVNEGTSTVYTAPSSNPSCVDNATITLKAGARTCSTLQIAINAYTGPSCGCVYVAYDCYCTGIYVREFWYIYDCLGTLCSTNSGQCGGPAGVWVTCVQGCSTPPCSTSAVYDFRSAAQIAAGCCPPQLL